MALSARTRLTAAVVPPGISLVPEPPPLALRQEGIRFFRGILLATTLSLPFWTAVFLTARFLR
jgi:hypothetical protein